MNHLIIIKDEKLTPEQRKTLFDLEWSYWNKTDPEDYDRIVKVIEAITG